MPSEKGEQARVLDLTLGRDRRHWTGLVLPVLLLVGAGAVVWWVFFRREQPEVPPRPVGLENATRESFQLPGGVLSLYVETNEWQRAQEGPEPVIALVAGEHRIPLSFRLLAGTDSAEDAAQAFIEEGRIEELYPGTRLRMQRFRWLDEDHHLGAWELRFGLGDPRRVEPEGNPVHHRLYIQLPDGVLLLTWMLPAHAPLLLADRVESTISTLGWKG